MNISVTDKRPGCQDKTTFSVIMQVVNSLIGLLCVITLLWLLTCHRNSPCVLFPYRLRTAEDVELRPLGLLLKVWSDCSSDKGCFQPTVVTFCERPWPPTLVCHRGAKFVPVPHKEVVCGSAKG